MKCWQRGLLWQCPVVLVTQLGGGGGPPYVHISNLMNFEYLFTLDGGALQAVVVHEASLGGCQALQLGLLDV